MANTWNPNKKLVQDVAPSPVSVAPTPLSRAAFIDPATGAERPINNAVTNPANYQADLATGQKNAGINKEVVKVAESKTLSPEQKQTQMDALRAQKTAPVGITPEMRTQIVAERDLPQNQYRPPAVAAPTVARDLAAERKTMNKLGLDKNNPEDVKSGYQTVYTPPQISELLKSGQVDASVFSAQELTKYGLTPDRIKQLVDAETDPARKQRLSGLYGELLQTGQMGAQVESTLNATPKPTNQMMQVLSDALNAKNNYKNQALGTSDLFKAAGLSGYSVLAQSLGQRMNEMQDKSKSAQNYIAEAGGAMATTYKNIADNYNKVLQNYNQQMKMLLDIDADAKKHEEAMELMNQQDALEKKTYEWKKSVDAKYATEKPGQTTPRFDSDGNFLGYWDENSKTFVESGGGGQGGQSQPQESGGWLSGLTNMLGKISGKYESGNDYGRVSTGAGDAGGKSYGSHQFSSKVGSLNTFLNDSGYAKDFKGLTPGSSAFDAKWKELAKNPAFQQAQDKQIETKYYKPALEKLKTAGIDLAGRSQPIHEMIYSTSVQYGPNTDVIKKALAGKDVKKMTDEEIIKTVQTYKGNTVGSYFSSSSEAVRNGVKNRTKNEMNDLISMGAKTGWAVGGAGGQGAPSLLGGLVGGLMGAAGQLGKPYEQSFEQRYFNQTNDRNILDPKSDLRKDLDKMNEIQREQYLKGVVEKSNKAGRSA
jgi:hypothetical protein